MNNSIRFLILVLSLSVFTSVGLAQNRERFGISAKAGGINALVGRVMVTRQGQSAQLLTSNDDLVTGDVVTTGSTSHVEVLLNPGSYLRVGENSEFEFEDSSLDNLRIKLVSGSAIVEATGFDGMKVQIHVATSQANFTIIRSGVYRINAGPNFAELAVRKGRATFGPNPTDLVKGGNKVIFNGSLMERAKLDKSKDTFDVWSKQRAELLARANQRLSLKTFNGYLATSFSAWDSHFWGRRRLGLWTYNPRMNCYTFLPFYYGWSSPYGHYYGSYYFDYGPGGNFCCNNRNNNGGIIVNNQTPPGPGAGAGGGGGGGTTPTPGGFGGVPTPRPAPNPVFRELDPYGGGRQVRKQDP